MELEAPMDSLGFCWVETGEPVQPWNLSQIEGVPSFSPVTGPNMFDQDVWEMSAIRFDHGHVCEHIPMELGGRTVLIWKPTAIIDDQTLDELNFEQGFVGMQEEIYNLEHCKTGRTISEMEMKSFCKKFPSARLSLESLGCSFQVSRASEDSHCCQRLQQRSISQESWFFFTDTVH